MSCLLPGDRFSFLCKIHFFVDVSTTLIHLIYMGIDSDSRKKTRVVADPGPVKIPLPDRLQLDEIAFKRYNARTYHSMPIQRSKVFQMID